MTHEDAPEVHCDKQTEVEHAMKREKEDEQVVRNRLEIAVDRMECMRGERCRDWG
jgi:dephospho-CoA kinase